MKVFGFGLLFLGGLITAVWLFILLVAVVVDAVHGQLLTRADLRDAALYEGITLALIVVISAVVAPIVVVGDRRKARALEARPLAEPIAVAATPDALYAVELARARLARVSDGVIAEVAVSPAGRALCAPRSVVVDATGTIYVADPLAGEVWRVGPNEHDAFAMQLATPGAAARIPIALALKGDALLVADNGAGALLLYSTEDGIKVIATGLKSPRGVAVGPDSVVYVTSKFGNRVFAVHPAGDIRTVAGTGRAGFSGDGSLASSATLSGPTGVAVGEGGTLFVSDTDNHRVRAVDVGGTIVTIAGTGVPGPSGDGGPAVEAELSAPAGLAFLDGTLYVADTGNDRIRAIRPNGLIETAAPRRIS